MIQAVVNEDNNEIIDASSEKEPDDNDVDDASEDVELLAPDFDCPAAGLYPSPTNCGQYYQCTAEKTVTITFIFLHHLFLNLHFSLLSSHALTVSTMTPISRLATGLTQ